MSTFGPFPSFLLSFFHSQLLVSLPYPTHSFTGQVIIVTGSNTGLGFEAAKHFVRLGAARVILAVRNLEKGATAKSAIELSHPDSSAVVEVWQLDLGSFESVKHFAERVKGMERLDVLVENAGIQASEFRLVEGNESTITTNVISTELLALLVLPKLKETARKFNVVPRLSIVTSDLHFIAKFAERPRVGEDVFEKLNKEEGADIGDRYLVSKLLEVFFVRELASRISSASKTSETPVIVNCMTPGWCKSDFMRELSGVAKVFVGALQTVLGRSTEVGSRTLIAGAAAGVESHGEYMENCRATSPSALVLSEEGRELQSKLWVQTMRKLETIQPEISRRL